MSDLLIRRESPTVWRLRLLLGDERVALGHVRLEGGHYTATLTDGTPVQDLQTSAEGFDTLQHAAEDLAHAYRRRAEQLAGGVDTRDVGTAPDTVIEEETAEPVPGV